jgi:hypothetical protein
MATAIPTLSRIDHQWQLIQVNLAYHRLCLPNKESSSPLEGSCFKVLWLSDPVGLVQKKQEPHREVVCVII